MNNPKKILVILDKPKHPQTALGRAVALAREAGAHLHLASFCWLPMAERSEVFETHQRRALKQSATSERRRWLDALVLDQGLSAADISTEVVWTDDIAGWVAEHVDQAGTDLVVKSVHHSESLLHTPLDWRLLRECQAPLLLVSTRRGARSGNVLATVDLTSTDAEHERLNSRVLDAASRFAELEDARLHCVHAVEVYGSFEDLEFFDTPVMEKKARDDARARLEEMLAPYGVARSHIHAPTGKVGQAVAEVAREIDADLLVVGTGAHRGLGARLLGSSAEKILTRAHCDVLAVHV
ncbi:MAG: universal stress protein [Pseudomonadota bacterium]